MSRTFALAPTSSARAVAAAVALMLAFLAGPTAAQAAGAVVFRDHGKTTGQATEPNICGWPSQFDGAVEWTLTAVDAGDRTFHVTYHETDNWTLVILDDPSTPASVRGETWRGRNEFTYVLNIDPSTGRGVEFTVNPNGEGPFHGLLDRVVLVIDPDGTVRVDSHEILGSVDCSVFS